MAQRLFSSLAISLCCSLVSFGQASLPKQTSHLSKSGGTPTPAQRYGLESINKSLGARYHSTSRGTGQATFNSFPSSQESYSFAPNEEVRLIVQFKSPALGAVVEMSSPKIRSQQSTIQSALSLIHQEHAQFLADLSAIEAASGKAVRSVISQTQIRFDYSRALNGMALTTTRWMGEQIQKLPYVLRVSLDEKVHELDDVSNEIIGAPAVWNNLNVHGEGIDIGFIDTGVDYLHAALGHAPFPNNKVVGGYDFVNNDPDPMDDAGHGTHVAAIAAGDAGTVLRGVAYKARVWAFKSLDATGFGWYSWIVAAIEKAMDPDDNPSTPTPIKILNFSLGTDVTFSAPSPTGDALIQAVNNAVRSGIVCVVAAGNLGPYYAAIGSPGSARLALTVGATADSTSIAGFSSRGPEWYTWGLNTGIKPDVVAPGVAIRSAKLGGGYISYSGTSMATPHVAGAAALLLQMQPDWTPAQVKAVFMQSAHDMGQDAWTQGGGRISISDAVTRKLIIEPSNIDFGLVGHAGTVEESTLTLTITNFDTISQSISLRGTYNQDTNRNPWLLPDQQSYVTTTITPSLVTIDRGASVTVTVTLKIHNLASRVYTNPLELWGWIVATPSSGAPAQIVVPYRFIYSMGFPVYADETPWWLNDYATWDLNWPVVDDTMFFFSSIDFWPVSPNIMVGTYFDRKSKIFKNIPYAPNQTVRVKRSDAKNKITVRCLDDAGNLITTIPGGTWGQLIRKKNFALDDRTPYTYTLGCGRFWSCPDDTLWHPEELDLPDLDSNWMVDLAYQIQPPNGKLYVFPFSIQGPLTSSMTLENDPYKFKRVDYSFASDGLNNSIYADSRDQSPVIHGYAFPERELYVNLTSEHTLTAYYLPRPAPEYSWGNYFLDVYYAPVWPPLMRTHTMDIESPDTANIFTKNISLKLTKNPISIRPGYGAPQWAGKMNNTSSGISLLIPAYGYFIHPEWSYTSEPAFHTLRSGTNLLSSGDLEYPTNWSAAAGSYTMDLTSTVYKVGDMSGHTSVRWEFDTRRLDPNPPYNSGNLLIITNGNISEEYHRDTTRITFVAKDDVGIDSATVFFRHLGSENWIEGTLHRSDSTYLVGDLPDLDGGYTSMRIRLVDAAHNVLDEKMEPAFVFQYAAPKNAPLLASPANGDTAQPAVMTLIWNPSFTSTSHRIQFATDSLMTHLLVDEAISNQDLRRVYPLDKGATYYWRVRGENPAGVGPFSSVWKFSTTTDTTFLITGYSRWNLISLPLQVKNRSPKMVFRTSGSSAYAYLNGRYSTADSLEYGMGYWLKFPLIDTFGVAGTLLVSDTVTLSPGWNIVGSISDPLPVGSIISDPPGMVASGFYSYDGAYRFSDTLKAGKAYWVKVNQAGRFTLARIGSLSKTNLAGRIRVVATSEKPPPPPDESYSPVSIPIPSEYALKQSYPNPFNPTTVIAYDLPEGTLVTLKIYNILGQEVKTLLDGYEPAGYKSVQFNARNLSSGIYFYALQTPKYRAVKKMLLAR